MRGRTAATREARTVSARNVPADRPQSRSYLSSPAEAEDTDHSAPSDTHRRSRPHGRDNVAVSTRTRARSSGRRCRLTIRPHSSCLYKSSTAAGPRLSPSRNTISETHPSHVSHGPRSFGTAAAAQSCHGSRRSQSATNKTRVNQRAGVHNVSFVPSGFPHAPRIFPTIPASAFEHVDALVLAETAEGGIPQNRREILSFSVRAAPAARASHQEF